MQDRCAVRHTLRGGRCPNVGTVEFYGEIVCEHHASRFQEGTQDFGTELEGIVFHLDSWLERARSEDDTEMVQKLEGALARALVELHLASIEVESRMWQDRLVANGVRVLFAALERHDRRKGEYSKAVAGLAVLVAREMGLPEEKVTEVEQVALLHHIGKIKIPASILEKREALDEDEWREIKEYPLVGARVVATVEGLAHLAPMIRAQHERWDGWGYPDGLKGEEIPLPSRIVFACSAYRAMTSDRPYSDSMDASGAAEELRKNSGTQFCPYTTQALLNVLSRTGERREVPAPAAASELHGSPAGKRVQDGTISRDSSREPSGAAPKSPGSGGVGESWGEDAPGPDRIEGQPGEGEERYRMLVELSSEPIAVHSAGKLLYINAAGAALLGAGDPEEVLGRPVLDFVHPDYAEIAAERIQRIIQDGVRTEAVEEKFVRLDGRVIDVEVTRIPVVYEGTAAAQVIIRDITERKRTEDAIRESEERFRSLIQHSSDIITVLKIDGTIRYESPSIERLLGYSPNELVGKDAFDYVHPDDVERVLEVFLEGIAQRGATRRVEFRFRHADGSWRHLEGIGNNLLHEPDIRGIVITSRDVTDRK